MSKNPDVMMSKKPDDTIIDEPTLNETTLQEI